MFLSIEGLLLMLQASHFQLNLHMKTLIICMNVCLLKKSGQFYLYSFPQQASVCTPPSVTVTTSCLQDVTLTLMMMGLMYIKVSCEPAA